MARVAVRLFQRWAVLMPPGQDSPRKSCPQTHTECLLNTIPGACWVSHKALLPGTSPQPPVSRGLLAPRDHSGPGPQLLIRADLSPRAVCV